MSPVDIANLAKEHAERLKEDIDKCVTRESHIRATARANEAMTLLHNLSTLFAADGTDEATSSGS